MLENLTDKEKQIIKDNSFREEEELDKYLERRRYIISNIASDCEVPYIEFEDNLINFINFVSYFMLKAKECNFLSYKEHLVDFIKLEHTRTVITMKVETHDSKDILSDYIGFCICRRNKQYNVYLNKIFDYNICAIKDIVHVYKNYVELKNKFNPIRFNAFVLIFVNSLTYRYALDLIYRTDIGLYTIKDNKSNYKDTGRAYKDVVDNWFELLASELLLGEING